MASTQHPLIAIDGPTLETLLPPSSLIPHLRLSLPLHSHSLHSPPRHSHSLSPTSSLLLMPCFPLPSSSSSSSSFPYLGVKILTVTPSVHASYSLFSSPSGLPLASLDGTHLTLLRTSSVSALASLLLSPRNPSTLLLLGAGALAPYLVSAHLSALPSLSRFLLWNRTPEKSSLLLANLKNYNASFEIVADVDAAVAAADVICCATGSTVPLVKGSLLKDGAHLNMVGSFKPEMMECDDEAIRRGRVFVDCEEALRESGELVGAIGRGVIRREDVVGTLADLADGKVVGRTRKEEITVFKSVGVAHFDLLAAQLAYETYIKGSSSCHVMYL